jgi:hypothetical protein
MDEDDGGLSPDSDDEYENSFSKKQKRGGAGGGRKSGGRSRGGRGAGKEFCATFCFAFTLGLLALSLYL